MVTDLIGTIAGGAQSKFMPHTYFRSLRQAIPLCAVLGLANACYGQAPDSAEIQELRQRMAEQAKQLEDLRQLLVNQQTQLERLTSAMIALTPTAPVASPAAPPAPARPPVQMAVVAAPTVPSVPAATQPLAVKIGDTTITPVGFMDLSNTFRDTNSGTSLQTNFGSIPFNNTVQGRLTRGQDQRRELASGLPHRLEGQGHGRNGVLRG